MGESKGNSKEDKVRRVEETVLSILALEGESRLTISHLAKQSRVTRPWIYKQFGASITDLMAFSGRVVSNYFALSVSAHPMRSREECKNVLYCAFQESLNDVERWPWVPLIYFNYSSRPGPVGDAIRAAEQIWCRRLVSVFCAVYNVAEPKAEAVALSMVKIWAAAMHSWIYDEKFKNFGRESAVQMMLSPFIQMDASLNTPTRSSAPQADAEIS